MDKLRHCKLGSTALLCGLLVFACKDGGITEPEAGSVRKPIRPSNVRSNPLASRATAPTKDAVGSENAKKFNESLDRIYVRILEGKRADGEDIASVKQILEKYAPYDRLRILASCPSYLYPYFENVILADVGPLPSADYATMLGALQTPASAAVLLSALEKCRPFKFPKEIPSPWHTESYNRGELGVFCRAVVANADPDVMQKYCDRLVAASDLDVQRVMLFGFRSSLQYADFDFLLQFRAGTENPILQREIDIALNHIASNLKNQGKLPLDDPEYWPANPGTLEERQSNRLQFQAFSNQADQILRDQQLKDEKLLSAY